MTVAERRAAETAELRRLRRRIDALDRRIVRLLNDRAELARDVGRAKAAAGRRAVRDPEREREVLLRISMANDGPTPQADLLAIFKRLFAVARSLERRDRLRTRRGSAGTVGTTATAGTARPGGGSGDADGSR